MAKRSRLSATPLPTPLKTLTPLGRYHEYEEFVLGPDIGAVAFAHWTAHLRSFWGWYSVEPDYEAGDGEIPDLRKAIAQGLRVAGFGGFAAELERCGSNESINRALLAQYTSDAGLYEAVNRELRRAHDDAQLADHPLTPWVLQLNAALRQRPTHEGPSYRGAEMSLEDIAMYSEGLLFEWATFVSASTDRDVAKAYDANVLFEIVPSGALTMYGKRSPYRIADFSAYPDEQEVVFPIACTYRVLAVERETPTRTKISLESVDFY